SICISAIQTKDNKQDWTSALVQGNNVLSIGSCNYRLSTTIKAKEFWAIVTYQKHHIRFKMNKKTHPLYMETSQTCFDWLKLPGQKFVDPPIGEEILNFIRELAPYATSHYSLMSKFDDVTINLGELLYGAILPDYLTNPGMKESKTYKTYHDLATRKSSEEEDDDEENVSKHEDDEDNERTESNNDGDDFVHPKFSTHDDEAKQDEEVNEKDSFDPRVQTPSHVESTDDEDGDDVIQDANVEGDMVNEEETHEEVEANLLYRDMNVNIEGRDTVMTDAPLPNV
ncbi:hypothetical protein Tco_0899581, partial [Tanacetum coccineum]